jgi:hypothetical protein
MIEGRKRYTVYLDQDATEHVMSFFKFFPGPKSGGFSGFLNHIVCNMSETLKLAGVEPGKKISKEQVERMKIEGLNLE